jgi:hypothetical protein
LNELSPHRRAGLGAAPEPPLRFPRRSRHDAVAKLVPVQELGNGLEIRAAIAWMQRLGGAPENIKLIVGERDRRRHGSFLF